jgi:hypothetical protein
MIKDSDGIKVFAKKLTSNKVTFIFTILNVAGEILTKLKEFFQFKFKNY